MGKWKTTEIPGLRYRLHPERKMRNNAPDRYYSFRVMVHGKRREEGLGFASEGWTMAKAAQIAGKIRANIRSGQGPQSLAEMRLAAQAERQTAETLALDQVRSALTFAELVDRYIAWARDHKPTWKDDQTYMRLHAIPVIGHLCLHKITSSHIEQIMDRTRAMGRADGTIKHAAAITRLIFNWASRTPWSNQDERPIFEGKNPVKGVKLPNPDYYRLRFLTQAEARQILDLAKHGNDTLPPDQDLHDIILVALYTGLRRGAILDLQWQFADLDNALLHVPAASMKTRTIHTCHLVDPVVEMLNLRRAQANGHQRIFPSRTGLRLDPDHISKRFRILINALGLNQASPDQRQHIVFHTLRHTCASWLAQTGTDIYTLMKIMGHKNIAMTMRYAHLIPAQVRANLDRIVL